MNEINQQDVQTSFRNPMQTYGASVINVTDPSSLIVGMEAQLRGLTLISKKYNNGKSLLTWKCPNPDHKPFRTSWYNLKYKFKHCKQCPSVASKGEKAVATELKRRGIEFENVCDDEANTAVTNHPLKISKASTANPQFFPTTRNTFVAPTFPLPCSRISMPLTFFATK